VDAAGNPDPTPATYSWQVDTAAPETFIDAAPPDPSASVDASFTLRSDDPAATFECSLDAATFVYVDAVGLVAGATHDYVVAAFDQAGNESASGPVPVTLPDLTPPDAPTGLIGVALNSESIQLDWLPASDNVGIVGYHVHRDGAMVATLGATTQFVDTGRVADTTYTYEVVAFDAAGLTSPPSLAVDVTTPPLDTARLKFVVPSPVTSPVWPVCRSCTYRSRSKGGSFCCTSLWLSGAPPPWWTRPWRRCATAPIRSTHRTSPCWRH